MCPNPKESFFQNQNSAPNSGRGRGGFRGGRGKHGSRGGRHGGRGRGKHYNDRGDQGAQTFQNEQSANSNPLPSNNTNSGQLCNNQTQQGQGSQQTANSNFMTIQNPDDVRARNNIPEDARLVSYFVGGEDDAVNSFGSNLSAQPIKTHIQCVSRVQIRCASNMELNTAALLDTGSILNYVSHSLIEIARKSQTFGNLGGKLENSKWFEANINSIL